MIPPDWQRCTAEQLWHYLAWHLQKAGIGSVLVGGAAVSIHTKGVYQTGNLDLVPDDLQRGKIPDVMRHRQFTARRNRDFVHPECPHLPVRFPMGPVEVGGKSFIEPDEIEIEGRRLRLLSPTDCVKDRLSGYLQWRSRPFLDQAVIVCQHQAGRVDLGEIQRWCEDEGSISAFQELKRRVAASESARFEVVPMSPENPDAVESSQSLNSPAIFLDAREILSAYRFLRRIGFERNKVPILTHALATLKDGDMTLAVTDGDHWLESRFTGAAGRDTGSFLIPAKALRHAALSGVDKLVILSFSDGPGTPLLEVAIMNDHALTRIIYPTEPASGFPDRPAAPKGSITTVPKETMLAMHAVGVCAAKDAILFPKIGGVFFSPESGGVVVATDGRQLASVPAKVPDREFILPSSAVHVLENPDITSRDVEIVMSENPGDWLVEFRAGIHTLIAKTVAESYPDYRGVMPDHLPATVVIPEIHKIPLITRLSSLKGKQQSVRLTWDKPGHMTMTHQDTATTPVSFEIPVEIDGDPPPISLLPRFFANALTLGSALRLNDHKTACVVSDPSGQYCVLMPMRTFEDSILPG